MRLSLKLQHLKNELYSDILSDITRNVPDSLLAVYDEEILFFVNDVGSLNLRQTASFLEDVIFHNGRGNGVAGVITPCDAVSPDTIYKQKGDYR